MYDDNDRPSLQDMLDSLPGSKISRLVLSNMSDPFALDTPVNRAKSAWLVQAMNDLGITDLIHARGIHYTLMTAKYPMPAGMSHARGTIYDSPIYLNDAQHSEWLEDVINIARWLGYIDFDQVIDKHSDEPVERLWTPPQPTGWIDTAEDFDIEVPGYDDLVPTARAYDFVGTQPNHLVIFGEKSSLEPVLGPVAERFQADLYLAKGDLTTTMVYRMAKRSAEDGRPTKVFYFADCDPGGYHMAIVLARKLQAFRVTHFPDLDCEIHRVGLTPEQVIAQRSTGTPLPESPLKEGENRAERWMEIMRVAQTELEATIPPLPDLLTGWAVEAISPFFDATLDRRVRLARREWENEAQQRLDEYVGDDVPQRCEVAAQRLAELKDEMVGLVAGVQVDVSEFDLPDIDIPEAELESQPTGSGLVYSSEWSFAEATRRLIAARKYEQ